MSLVSDAGAVTMRKGALYGVGEEEGERAHCAWFPKVVVSVSLPNGRDQDFLRVSRGRPHALVLFGKGLVSLRPSRWEASGEETQVSSNVVATFL